MIYLNGNGLNKIALQTVKSEGKIVRVNEIIIPWQFQNIR